MPRPVQRLMVLLSILLESMVVLAHAGSPTGSEPDSTSHLFFTLHGRTAGGTFGTEDERLQPVFSGSASGHLIHERFEAIVAWDVLQHGGMRMQRSMEAGYDRRAESGMAASRFRARCTWKPLPSLTLSFGRDTLHDGWGRRSLFRGRHVAPTPFLETRLDGGGRLRYRHRIEALQGAPSIFCWTGMTGDPRTWVPENGPLRAGIERMVVAHRLEFDLGRRFTGVLWGAAVWNTVEGTRVFEPHYLLPLTSLRPTEYAQGSSDNAIVGLEARYRLGPPEDRRAWLYGQILLDELIVSEVLGSTGWWGNKYGLLGGFLWNWSRGSWRVEMSGARPWTYSHYTPTAAYINGWTPLAHPLGANFIEATTEARMDRGPWIFHGRLTASRRGEDAFGDAPTGALPQIGDIDRTQETYDWLNGTARDFLLVQGDAARKVRLGKAEELQAFLRIEYATVTGPTPAETGLRAVVGLRTSGPLLGADW